MGEAISQLEWLWFQDWRVELIAMQGKKYLPTSSHVVLRENFHLTKYIVFEDASRDPLSSSTLLGHHKGRSVASLYAAILILLLAAFEPFV